MAYWVSVRVGGGSVGVGVCGQERAWVGMYRQVREIGCGTCMEVIHILLFSTLNTLSRKKK